MADTLITGTTLVEKESRSVGDIAVGGIIEFDDTFNSIPVSFVLCDGATITDPLSSYNGSAVPNLNTNYWSSSAINFHVQAYDNTVNYFYLVTPGGTDNGTMTITAQAGEDDVCASVNIPNGAIVTGAIVYGTDTGETWLLRRVKLDDQTDATMATAAIDTEDTSISNATIDNNTYGYFLTAGAGAADIIHGAKITYTPRFKFIIRIK